MTTLPGALLLAALLALAVAAGATGYAAFGKRVRPMWLLVALSCESLAIGLMVAAGVLAGAQS